MKKLYFLLLTILISAASFGQTTIFSESFETDGNGTRYNTSQVEFSDFSPPSSGGGDIFGRTNLNNTSEDAADLAVVLSIQYLVLMEIIVLQPWI